MGTMRGSVLPGRGTVGNGHGVVPVSIVSENLFDSIHRKKIADYSQFELTYEPGQDKSCLAKMRITPRSRVL
jgi:hypothetical protein